MSAEDPTLAAPTASEAKGVASEHEAVEAKDDDVKNEQGDVHDTTRPDAGGDTTSGAADGTPLAAEDERKVEGSGHEAASQQLQPAFDTHAEAPSKHLAEAQTNETAEKQPRGSVEAELDSAVSSTKLKLSTAALDDDEAPAPIAKSPVPDVPEKPASNTEAVANAFGRDTPKSTGSRASSPAPQQTETTTSAEKPESEEKETTDSTEGRAPKRKESIPTSQAAEEVPFDFNKFLDQMKHRSAAPVGEYVRR